MSSGGSGSSSGAPTPGSGHDEGSGGLTGAVTWDRTGTASGLSRGTVEFVGGLPGRDLRPYGVTPQRHGFKSAGSASI